MKSTRFFLMLAMMFLASHVCQTTGGGKSSTAWAVPFTSGISMAIASGLCALGQGKAVAGAAEAMARKSGRHGGDPLRADSRPGADRVAGTLHLRHHFVKVV